MTLLPKDGILTLKLLDDCGVAKCEPKVIPQLLELNYRMLRSILKESCLHAARLQKTQVTSAEVLLTLQLQNITKNLKHSDEQRISAIANCANAIPLDEAMQQSEEKMKPLLSSQLQIIPVEATVEQIPTSSSSEAPPFTQFAPRTLQENAPQDDSSFKIPPPSVEPSVPSLEEFMKEGQIDDNQQASTDMKTEPETGKSISYPEDDEYD
ncbi:putative Transcription initiation factor IID, 31kD subunit [Monocercomonoides exilis]|uniref:putative Transcription initiation factor IID, 31kD subunit n=1 Tax=Monocercomonoides exilis TaxID=2049356 RepID=UPI00355AB12C|nr:putative Transcription initiation factor IID, 31kD subunit [Monocercomonoides exilis]|eukprot:MONOS_8654.1-p1 / transcript=MONOS_8654.1 / gene=MONOS_8654 / organism=Monocercomonoides_exilis_PA203 / gene_product=unspecified product / transcript_product=unspecified product / location=Mono_scaffold00331:60244-60966(+) / protein_length=209 / sequence_SO=supercontig / SO=protein_coding / is_pseudo=false